MYFTSRTSAAVVHDYIYALEIKHCTKVLFASFFSGGLITAIVVNPPLCTGLFIEFETMVVDLEKSRNQSK